LRSELNQIKSEKTKAIEATDQANAEAKQEQLASISDKPSELNTGSVSFREDAFNVARYGGGTITEAGDYINDSDRLHAAINSLGKKEFALARQLFLNLADKGMAEAQINFGMMFESGQGVPQDFEEAIRRYQLAADLGLIKAQEKLNLLLNKKEEILRENSASSEKFKSLKELKKSYKEIKDLQTTNASLRSELDHIKSEKTRAIEATEQANAEAEQEQLASLKEFKNSYKEINDLQTTTASLRSELNQIKSEKTKAIEATDQANAEAKQEQLESLKELKKSYKEIKDLQIATASLRSELDQIKSEKTLAIEATDQANAEAKQEQLES